MSDSSTSISPNQAEARLEKQRIRFIINPIAGVRNKIQLPDLIKKGLDADTFDVDITFTQYAGHAPLIAAEAVDKGFDIVVAVGGDGTINEVASALVHSSVALGVIPLGSGNGLAHKLGISTLPEIAIESLNHSQRHTIDVGKINGEYFISNAGIGLEGRAAHRFDQTKRRGLAEYVRIGTLSFFAHKPTTVSVELDNGEQFETDAFNLNFGNSGQFGYKIGFTPQSDMSDGLLEMCLLKRFPMLFTFWLLILFLTGRFNWSKYVQVASCAKARIHTSEPMRAQIDGDPGKTTSRTFDFEIVPLALQVMVPTKRRLS